MFRTVIAGPVLRCDPTAAASFRPRTLRVSWLGLAFAERSLFRRTQGYGVPGSRSMDRIAKAGLRYTQFRFTALCSPSRAALITGRNHHSVGFGVVTEMSTGYPGYDSVIGPESATVGTILKQNGYATSWFGKKS